MTLDQKRLRAARDIFGNPAGVSLAIGDGAPRIYQTVAVKHKAKGLSGLPPTRADLYARATPES